MGLIEKVWTDCPYVIAESFIPSSSLRPIVSLQGTVLTITASKLVQRMPDDVLRDWVGGIRDYINGDSLRPMVATKKVKNWYGSDMAWGFLRKRYVRGDRSQCLKRPVTNNFMGAFALVREHVPSAPYVLRDIEIYVRPGECDPTEYCPVDIYAPGRIMLIDGQAYRQYPKRMELLVAYGLAAICLLTLTPEGEPESVDMRRFVELMGNPSHMETMLEGMREDGWQTPGEES